MSDSSSDDEPLEPSAKRVKICSPVSFVTWNANGLVSRCLYNKDSLQELLGETNNPDVICLQEARLKATSPTNCGTPLAADYKSVEDVMNTVFRDYHKFWSLADTKYAGTLTLLHKRLSFPAHDSAFTTQSALSLLLNKYNLTRVDVGLSSRSSSTANNGSISTSNSAGTSLPKKHKQTTMKSFFAPKASPNKNSKPGVKFVSDHSPEGRFQFFAFPSFDLIQTYAPNNGTKEESFQRRRDWDHELKEFLSDRRRILEKAVSNKDHPQSLLERPLLWCGDLNVAADYLDGTHWERRGDDVYEFWTDEKQCFAGGQAKKLDPTRAKEDQGIPSFTTNERRRFGEILQQADLSDVWRRLHPDGETDDYGRNYKTQWDRPNWTWRGHLSKDGNAYKSKYQGKGQRLDYFLLSPSSLTSQVVEKCEIMGWGERREGFFCGSDHCATMLMLKNPL